MTPAVVTHTGRATDNSKTCCVRIKAAGAAGGDHPSADAATGTPDNTAQTPRNTAQCPHTTILPTHYKILIGHLTILS